MKTWSDRKIILTNNTNEQLYSWSTTFRFHKGVQQQFLGALEYFIPPSSAVRLRVQELNQTVNDGVAHSIFRHYI